MDKCTQLHGQNLKIRNLQSLGCLVCVHRQAGLLLLPVTFAVDTPQCCTRYPHSPRLKLYSSSTISTLHLKKFLCHIAPHFSWAHSAFWINILLSPSHTYGKGRTLRTAGRLMLNLRPQGKLMEKGEVDLTPWELGDMTLVGQTLPNKNCLKKCN